MPVVKLTSSELMVAAMTGAMRRVKALNKNYNAGIYHAAGNEWSTDIDGAAAEMAVAKHLETYWSCHLNTFKAADVLSYQVRSTHYKTGKLIVRPHDNPEEKYILVICSGFDFDIKGWMYGHDAMRLEFFERGEGSALDHWKVPQDRLESMRELR